MNLLAKDKEHKESFKFLNAGSLAYIGNWYSSFLTYFPGDNGLRRFLGKPFMIDQQVEMMVLCRKRRGELLGCSGVQLISQRP